MPLVPNGQRGVEGEYQRAINRMARFTLGASRSTPQGILAAESGLAPARAPLNHRQSRFTQRLLARPQDGSGPEGILETNGAAITRRLKVATDTRPGETVEPQVWSEDRTFPSSFCIAPREQALGTARSWRTRDTIWTDGSRFGSGKVGAACAWWTREGWTNRRFHLDNKEVFDAEIFAIYQALGVFRARQESGRKYTVFSDSQSAIRRAGPPPEGTTEGSEVPGWALLLAAFGPCRNWVLPTRKDDRIAPQRAKQVPAVWQRQERVAPPPFRGVPGLNPPDPEAVEAGG